MGCGKRSTKSNQAIHAIDNCRRLRKPGKLRQEDADGGRIHFAISWLQDMAFPVTEHNNKKERIGRMNRRIQFMIPITSRDAMGGEVHSWLQSNSVFASVEYRRVGSDEKVIGDRPTAVTAAIVTVRYQPVVYPKMRLIYAGFEWEIESVLHDSHRRYTTMECKQYKPYWEYAWITPDGDMWTDPNGNVWVYRDPEGDPLAGDIYIRLGNLVWTDADSNEYVLNQSS